MGLDMYLKGKRYMSDFFRKGDKKIQESVQELFPELKDMQSHFDGPVVNEIVIDAGYWRKANQIHAWFVKECQKGVDDCGEYYVTRDKLLELKALCEAALKNRGKASETLPRQSGFFFGGTEYDEWYFRDLENTIAIIDRAVALPKNWDLYYTSSW